MKEFLSKIPFIGNFFKNEADWHNPKYILKVINEKEFRSLTFSTKEQEYK